MPIWRRESEHSVLVTRQAIPFVVKYHEADFFVSAKNTAEPDAARTRYKNDCEEYKW